MRDPMLPRPMKPTCSKLNVKTVIQHLHGSQPRQVGYKVHLLQDMHLEYVMGDETSQNTQAFTFLAFS